MQIEDWQDLFTRAEPLCDELKRHVSDGPFGPCLKHPLVFCVIGLDLDRAALYNEQLRRKQAYVDKSIAEKEWSAAIWIHERPYRLEAFAQYEKGMTDQEYWSILGSLIVDSENLWQCKTLLKCLLAKRDQDRHFLMNEEEQSALAELPEEFPIWRGCQMKNRNGFSWTLDRDKAIWFAKRLNKGGPRLHSGTISKTNVIAHFLGRSEAEIFVLPNKVKNKKLEMI